jgi:TPR repeat protein
MTRIDTIWLRAIVILAVVAGTGRADHPKPREEQKAAMAVSQSAAQLRAAEEDYRRGLRADGGIGVPQDYLAAAKYYQKAAEKGHVPAQYNLGFLYEKGMGVKRDFAQAAFWYRKAADQGDPEAQNNLGISTRPDRACLWTAWKPCGSIVWPRRKRIWKA